VCFTELVYGFKNSFFESCKSVWLPRLQQLPDATGYEAIRVQRILLDIQGGIFSFQITGPIAFDAMAKNQVLGPRG
jgi:hypothetical protein